MSSRSVRTCPICRKPRSAEHAPFCSTRCRDRDLVRWLEEGYAIPGRPADPRHGSEADDPDDRHA